MSLLRVVRAPKHHERAIGYYQIAPSNPNVKVQPIITPKDAQCSCPCSCAIGISSSRVMNTITPAAKANPNGTSPGKALRNTAAITAPNGSVNPESKAKRSAPNLEAPLI